MNIELSDEKLCLSQTQRNETTQILVEGDVIVPDTKPDILTILQTDADAIVTGYEARDGILRLTGTIFLKILYAPEGAEENRPTIKSIHTKFDFTDELAVPDAENALVRLSADAEQVDCSLVHSRKMNFKVVVALSLKTHTRRDVRFVTDVSGDRPVETRRQKLRLFNLKTVAQTDFVVEETLDVPGGKPDIGEALDVAVKIHPGECKVMNRRVMLQGDLSLCSLYCGDMDGQGIELMEHELPFSETVDVDALAEGDLCDVRFCVKDVYFSVKDDMNGDPRQLAVEILIGCSVCATELCTVDTVSDCYAPGWKTELTTQKTKLEELLYDDVSQTTLRQQIVIPTELPSVDGVYNVIAKPFVTGTSVSGDTLTVEGNVAVTVLYVSADAARPLYSYRERVPFRHDVRVDRIDASMTADVAVAVKHTSFSLNMSSEVEARCLLEFSVKVVRAYEADLISDCSATEPEETRDMPSLVVYFTQPGDCMWDIAKRYHTTVGRIQSANRLEEDFQPTVGQKILIPRTTIAMEP